MAACVVGNRGAHTSNLCPRKAHATSLSFVKTCVPHASSARLDSPTTLCMHRSAFTRYYSPPHILLSVVSSCHVSNSQAIHLRPQQQTVSANSADRSALKGCSARVLALGAQPTPCCMMALKSCPKLHSKQHAACSTARQLSPVQNPHRRSVQRFVVSCSAGSLTASESSSGGLAIYSWPKASKPVRQQPVTRSPTKLWSTQMWFEAMVQTVVKQLDGGAFLLRVSANPVLSLKLIRLEAADFAAGWEHIQQCHLESALQQDEAVILVHPVASQDQPCLVRQAGEACAGCPHTVSEVSAAAAAAAAAYGGGVTASYAAPPTTELLHGKFGECCEDGQHSHDHAHHQHSSSAAQQPQPPQQQASAVHPETQTAFYGLVVQTRDAADPLQGCYLLKTMKQSSSSSSACHCTHYSLNQICKGPSLQQQYQASWLV